MSAAAPPIATGSHQFATAADKEALVQFWRSGLEHIARGITAHHSIIRDTRIYDTYSRRGPPRGSVAPSLDPQIVSNKETLEGCILALAELAASGLAQSSLCHQTHLSPSLETRVAALEGQIKAFQETVKPLDAKVKTLTSNLARMSSRIKACEEQANNTATHSDQSHRELESRIIGLSAQITNPPPTQIEEHGWVNEHLEPLKEQIQAFQNDSARIQERLTTTETRLTVVEAARTRVDAHGTKLALMDGRVATLQKDLRETQTKMTMVLALAPDAKVLSSVPAQIQLAGENIQSLKEQQEAASTRLSSLESSLHTLERKLEETNQTTPTVSDSLTADVLELSPLKQHVHSIVKLPTTLDQLQASVAELAPLKLRSQELSAIAAQAPQLIGLISHNERVQDDITQIRSKLVRYNKEIADAKKENTESLRLLKEEMTTLSFKASRIPHIFNKALTKRCTQNQTMQGEISGAAAQVARLELGLKRAEEVSMEVLERMGGIDARFKANQVTAQWAQEQIRTMRADITYLEPLKAEREALLLLSGRTEELMPLSIQLKSSEFQKILKKGEHTDAVMAAARTLTADMVAACKDVQQRLSRVEPHVTQLESDVSSTLEKLGELQRTSDTTGPQVKGTNEMLQKLQNDIAPLLTFKPGILELVKLLPHCSTLISLVGQVRALQQTYAGDIVPIKGEVRKIKLISSGMATLRTDMEDAKGKIAPLLALQEQLQVYQGNLDKLEQKVAKLESEPSSSNNPLAMRTPLVNRAAGFSLSQSLGTGSNNPGTPRLKPSISSSPRKSSSAAQQQPQPELPATPPPPGAQTPPQSLLPGSGVLTKLTPLADEVVSLIERSKQTETAIANLSRSLNKSNKELGELHDSVHGLDQLMTTIQRTSGDNQVTLKLLEREFQNVKEDNVAKSKEIDLRQAHITVMENEFQSLKLDVGAKLKVIETTAHELTPLKEHADILLALAQPVFSPTSPAPHTSAAPPESRLVALERSSKSATKELINLNAWVARVAGDIKSCRSLSAEFQALEGLVRGLAGPTQATNPLAASLTERASALLALLERPSGQSIQLTPEQIEEVAQSATKMKTLEEQMHALQMSQPKLKGDLEQVTSQVGELVPTIEVIKPFTDHVQSILSLVPLSSHVPSLVPLIDQVSQLNASIESLSDRVDAAVSAATAIQTPADPSPASQLRSPVTDREPSPEQSVATDNTALFASATSEPRPNKRRRTEDVPAELLESFENRLDGIQGELDGVVDDVKVLYTERGKAKKMRPNTGEKKQPTGGQSLESGETPESPKRIHDDLDTIMDQMRSLFEGEGVWPERIDIVLGRQWAQALQSSQPQSGAGASTTIAKLCNELEILKMAIEAHGSGTVAPPSMVDPVHVTWAENLTKAVMTNVNKEQAQFKAELEELIGRALEPMRKVFKVFKESPDIV